MGAELRFCRAAGGFSGTGADGGGAECTDDGALFEGMGGALLETLQMHALPEAGFLLHSYGGPAEMVGAFVELGGYFSFSGYFAHDRKARQREVFRQIPLERILMETDAPDMLPPEELIEFPIAEAGEVVPNNPANIRAIYEYFARLRGVELGEMAEIVGGNYRRLFGRGLR